MTDEPERPQLVVEGGASDDESIPLLAPSSFMGRQPGNEVVVAEAGVSRKHAEIVETEGEYYLRDLKSTNGTFVNDKRLEDGDYLLKDGDSIRLGASKVSYIFRSPMANTLALTLDQTVIEELGSVAPGGDEKKQGPAVTMATEIPEEFQKATEETELYEGTIRLKVDAVDSMGHVVNFVQQIREKPEFRLLRMANNREGGTDIWLALREPIPLRDMLVEMETVSAVSPTAGRDLSVEGEDTPLTVMLKPESTEGHRWTA